MPGLDRTGPNGEGSQTGRGLGKCNPDTKNNDTKTPSEDFYGRGHRFRAGNGLGRGAGRGLRRS